MRLATLLIALSFALPARAQHDPSQQFKPMPERKDVLSWRLLSQMPQTCAFCLSGGPEQMVEVKASKAVKYTFEPVVVSGKLTVLKDDPTGVFYRLIDATESN